MDVGLPAREFDDARKLKLSARDALGTATTAEALARQAYDDGSALVPEGLRRHDLLQSANDAAPADLGSRKQVLADADLM